MHTEVTRVEFPRWFEYDVIVHVTGSAILVDDVIRRCVDKYRSLKQRNIGVGIETIV